LKLIFPRLTVGRHSPLFHNSLRGITVCCEKQVAPSSHKIHHHQFVASPLGDFCRKFYHLFSHRASAQLDCNFSRYPLMERPSFFPSFGSPVSSFLVPLALLARLKIPHAYSFLFFNLHALRSPSLVFTAQYFVTLLFVPTLRPPVRLNPPGPDTFWAIFLFLKVPWGTEAFNERLPIL